MGLIYSYDGTLAGLFSACGQALLRGDDPDALVAEPTAGGLFDTVVTVAGDQDAARETAATFARRASPVALGMAIDAFRSEAAGIGTLLWRYFRLGMRLGRKIDALLAHDHVLPVHRLARQVRYEAHRMKGFVRFREIEHGLYYAAIETDHAVLPLLAGHFVERFADRDWIIHDVGRGRGLLYDAGRATVREAGLEATAVPGETAGEREMSALWRTFFREVAVAERENPRLQRQKVPLRYRKNLTEF